MAKVRGPAYAMDASGLLGNLVYARNRYGQYSRAAPGAAGAPTAEQTAWRNAMSACVTGWETDAAITAERRSQWEDFSRAWPQTDRWGNRIHLDAMRWYCKLNIHRQRKGYTRHAGPPIHPLCEYYPTFYFTVAAWGISLDVSPRPTGDQLVLVSRVDAQNTVRNFCPNAREYVGHFGSSDTWPRLIWRNGDMDVATKRYFFVLRAIDGSGRASCQQIFHEDAARDTAGLTVPVTYDASIRGDNPTVNYGGIHWVLSTYTVPWQRRGLFIGDFQYVPPNAVVSAADLMVNTRGVAIAGNHRNHELWVDWVEMECTYNIRKTGTNWGVPGGQSGVDYDGTQEDTVNLAAVDTWYGFDCAIMVQNWIDLTRTNYGTILIPQAPDASASVWSSEEEGTSLDPYYLVTFT